MEIELLKVLSAGGDLATMGLCLALWRLDRRILRVETLIECIQNTPTQKEQSA